MSRASLNKDPREVAGMFDTVARRYDLTNDVMSGFQVRAWRAVTRAAVGAGPGMKVLDLAAGTGTSTNDYALAGAQVVACDFSIGMMQEGKRRYPDLQFVAGDATALPFADDAFDVVTISYGLRNVNDTLAALRQMYRVTKPGGRIVIAEFSTPTFPVFGVVYKEYLMRALPLVARVVSSNPEAYEYLAESIRAWPNQEELARAVNESGWADCGWQNMTGGITALHSAVKAH